MNFLMRCARKYVKRMDLWDVSFLKLCLCSMGVLIGLGVCQKRRRAVGVAAIFIFIATYIPLVSKFVGIVSEERTAVELDDDCFEYLD